MKVNGIPNKENDPTMIKKKKKNGGLKLENNQMEIKWANNYGH